MAMKRKRVVKKSRVSHPKNGGGGGAVSPSGGRARRVPQREALGVGPQRTNIDSDWNLRLYVAGRSPKSRTALANLERLCNEHIPGRFRIEVVDLVANPQLARADEIIAIPTLIRRLPVPVKRLIGDLSNTEKAMVALEMRPRG
jgi:circadian clock protein KaiB